MKKFWELFKESIIIQGSIALIITSTICYLYVNGRPVPSELMNVLLLILGVYFGAKTTGGRFQK